MEVAAAAEAAAAEVEVEVEVEVAEVAVVVEVVFLHFLHRCHIPLRFLLHNLLLSRRLLHKQVGVVVYKVVYTGVCQL